MADTLIEIKSRFEKDVARKPPPDVVQRYLLDEEAFCFSNDIDLFCRFRHRICKFFEIHPQDFAIVGSAKMGFSLSPKKYGKPFNEASDIDVVLVSDDLFQMLWLELIAFKKSTVYRLESRFRTRFDQLQRNVFYGVLRMDKLTDHFPFAKDWWRFFNEISKDDHFGPRRVRGAIYKSWHHVTLNYERSITEISRIIGSEK